MKIILQQDVESLGLAGEVVDVAKGYARNYLLPKKFAALATPANQKLLAATMSTVADRKKRAKDRAKDRAAQIEDLTLTITAKVGEEGKLFGSVTSMDLAKALAERGFEVDRKKIELKTPIKSVGQHEVPLRLEAGVTATLSVEVVPEGEEA